MGSKKFAGVPLPENAEVRCIACGGPLVFQSDAYPLVFRCDAGHALTLEDLLDQFLRPRVSAQEYWKNTSALIAELAGRALSEGHALAAADLLDSAHRINQWAVSLRKLLDAEEPALHPRRA